MASRVGRGEASAERAHHTVLDHERPVDVRAVAARVVAGHARAIGAAVHDRGEVARVVVGREALERLAEAVLRVRSRGREPAGDLVHAVADAGGAVADDLARRVGQLGEREEGGLPAELRVVVLLRAEAEGGVALARGVHRHGGAEEPGDAGAHVRLPEGVGLVAVVRDAVAVEVVDGHDLLDFAARDVGAGGVGGAGGEDGEERDEDHDCVSERVEEGRGFPATRVASHLDVQALAEVKDFLHCLQGLAYRTSSF